MQNLVQPNGEVLLKPTSRRRFLAGIGGAAALSTAPAAVKATHPVLPSQIWADLIATLEGLVPEGARLQILGNAKSCRIEVMGTFKEPIHPNLPGQLMNVEWITASYRLTEDGWHNEGYSRGRRE